MSETIGYSWEESNKQIAEKYGIPEDQIIRFDMNEVPYVLDSATRTLKELGIIKNKLSCYPTGDYSVLVNAISSYCRVDPSKIFVDSGADGVLATITRAWIQKGEKVVVLSPAYSMYRILCSQAQAEIKLIDIRTGIELKKQEILEEIRDARMVFICNPNNPLGSEIEQETIEEILKSTKGFVIVDEAYYEFSGNSSIGLVLEYQNLVVVRTLSKAWGLASLRVGYAIACQQLVSELNSWREPVPIPIQSAFIAERVLRNGLKDMGTAERVLRNGLKDMGTAVEGIKLERDRIARRLSDKGMFVLPSETNFVSFYAGGLCDSMAEKLMAKGMVIRNQPSGLNGFLRICVREQDQNDQLLQEIVSLLPRDFDSVIFDVDGTLIDTYPSYDQAIKETARELGKSVCDYDIQAIRSKGFNNDWDITFALVYGSDCIDSSSTKYQELKEIFQKFYSRFKGGEKLLIEKQTLGQLRNKGLKIGLASDRPDDELQEAIELIGFEFDFVGKGKISKTEKIRAGVKELGSKKALYIGNTVSDLNAAREAGISSCLVAQFPIAPADYCMRDVNEILKVIL